MRHPVEWIFVGLSVMCLSAVVVPLFVESSAAAQAVAQADEQPDIAVPAMRVAQVTSMDPTPRRAANLMRRQAAFDAMDRIPSWWALTQLADTEAERMAALIQAFDEAHAFLEGVERHAAAVEAAAPPGDLNGDGLIDGADLGILLGLMDGAPAE